ncbi:RNA repair domain-containing protein [Sulfolobus tengchongensis]|uniref:UPF0248 protein V6M85_06390 n=1 Tax=Sulfolobus tengchongensis TaxID=207809 RepID=A0AAX4L564_9CREN
MRIKDAINMIIWKYPDKLHDYVVIIKDRLADKGLKEIYFNEIERVDNYYLYLKGNEDIVIPLHRVLMIRRKSDNATIWKRGD